MELAIIRMLDLKKRHLSPGYVTDKLIPLLQIYTFSLESHFVCPVNSAGCYKDWANKHVHCPQILFI